jgi:outer membrane protein
MKTKMTTRISVALAVLCAFPAMPALADRPLPLAEALQQARLHNHDLGAARARLREVKGNVDRAFAALMPVVTGVGTYTHNYKNVTYANLFSGRDLPPDQAAQVAGLTASLGNIIVIKGDALQGTLALNLPLVNAPAWLNLGAAKEQFTAQEADNAVTETTVLFAVAQAFYAAAGGDELLQARQHAVEVAQATLGNAQARFAASKATRLETDRAQLAVVNATQAVREARDLRDAAYRSLATLTGVKEAVSVAPEVQDSAATPDVPALVAQSYTLRPELKLYRANLNVADKQSKAALWQWAPTVAGYGNLNGYNYAGITGDYYSWALGVQLTWVFYDGGVRDAARRQSQAQRDENAERLAQLQLTVADDIANAAQALATKRDGLASAEQARAIAAEALDIVRLQYAAGTATQLDVLQAQDALVNAEVQRAQARFDLALADLSLRRDAGSFPRNLATR